MTTLLRGLYRLLFYVFGHPFLHPPDTQRELTRVRMAQTLRGDLTSHQEAALIDLLTEKVGVGWLAKRQREEDT